MLVVDDDDVFRERLVRAFSDRGLAASGASGAAAAAVQARAESPELAVIDLRLGDGSGLDVLRVLREIDPTTRIVMLTGYGSIANAVAAMKLGAAGYLTKPANADEILRALQPEHSLDPSSSRPATLSRVEWEHLQRVLADCDGSISRAARALGLHRRSLQRKLLKDPGL